MRHAPHGVRGAGRAVLHSLKVMSTMNNPNNPKIIDITLKMPPGINLTMWKDGSLHITYNVDDVLTLRDTLVATAKSLNEQAIARVEAEKALEIERQKLPLNTMQRLDEKLDTLKQEHEVLPTIITGA